jgi:4-amino-4-deoxy-L-arabinose transferase-like glycosyltransferase
MTDAAKPSRRPRFSAGFWHAISAIALVVLTLGTFSNALRNEFVNFDDWPLIEHNELIRSLAAKDVIRVFTDLSNQQAWLPLRVLSYSVDYHFWGLNAFGYHLTNMLLHAANVLLVYTFLCRLLRRWPLALLGAAWFAVHPVQVEAVTWASGRRDVLYGLFFLLGLLAFLRFDDGGRRRWGYYVASLVCVVLVMLSKASGMVLPAILVLFVLLYEREGRRLGKRLWACVPHGVLAGGLMVAHVMIAQQQGVMKALELHKRMVSVPWIHATYFRLLFFPVHLSTPHAMHAVLWWQTGLIVWPLVAVVVVVAAIWWAAPNRRLALFGLGWWFLLLLPVSQVVPLSILAAERYLYMPLVGACALGASLVGWLAERRRLRGVVIGCAVVVLGLFAAATRARNRTWRNAWVFWQDGVSKWPRASVPRIGLAAVYVQRGQPLRAWRQYVGLLTPDEGPTGTDNPEIRNLVRTGVLLSYDRSARRLEARGEVADARGVYERAARLWPQRVDVQIRLAEFYERHGMREAALAQLVRVRRLYERQAEDHPEEFEQMHLRFPWVRGWLERRRRGPVLQAPGVSRRAKDAGPR